MRALTGFLKVVAACLEGTRFEGPLRWSLIVAESVLTS